MFTGEKEMKLEGCPSQDKCYGEKMDSEGATHVVTNTSLLSFINLGL
jgi:hypothetical protein